MESTALTSSILETDAPPEELRVRLLAKLDQVSMLPAAALKALELAKNPDCSTSEFAELVERDVKLATEILSLANSPLFSHGRPVMHLQQAVVRLGFRQCRNLILTSSAASLMKSLPMEQESIREVLWHHSYFTATACVHLNRLLKLGFQGEEFTSGLLHDFGRLLLAVATPESFEMADSLTFQETGGPQLRERAILGTDHCHFGAWFAERNGLPEAIIAAVLLHHTPAESSPHDRLVRLTAAGDDLANHFQRQGSFADYDVASNRGLEALDGILPFNVQERFAEAAESVFEAIEHDTGATA
jgi:HD-like signal output (HDOD) protein